MPRGRPRLVRLRGIAKSREFSAALDEIERLWADLDNDPYSGADIDSYPEYFDHMA